MFAQIPPTTVLRQPMDSERRGAVGKSLLVYLFSGSLGLALLAFILFKMIGW